MKQTVFRIAGVQHRPAADIDKAIADGLAKGSKLQLVPEPANRFDPSAIAVMHFGVKIGYVPKIAQKDVQGATTAVMSEFNPDDPPWERFSAIADVPSDGESTPAQDAALEIVAAPYSLEGIGATEAARRHRDDLLAKAQHTAGIEDADAARAAAALMADMARFTRTIEETREAVKRPLLEAGRKIDATAKDLVAQVEAESKRLGTLLGGYQAAQRRLEEDARRRAYQEQERIRREAEDKERRIREEAEAKRRLLNEERNRMVAEIDPATLGGEYADLTDEQFAAHLASVRESLKARKAAEEAAKRAKSDRTRIEAERKAEEARKIEENRRREAEELAEKARKEREAAEARAEQERFERAALESAKEAEMVTAPANKLAGVAVGAEIKFEVTDVVALYEAAPYLVKLEPNKAAIKSALKQLPEGKVLPGVKHWKEAKTSIRL